MGNIFYKKLSKVFCIYPNFISIVSFQKDTVSLKEYNLLSIFLKIF